MAEIRETSLPRNLPTVDEVLQEAFSDRQGKADLFQRVDEDRVRGFINGWIGLIDRFEESSGLSRQEELLPKTGEEAGRIKAIWVVSAPGLYSAPTKDDRYKDKSWARWMDRNRAYRGAWLARRLTEIKIGQKLPHDRSVIKEAILEHGPSLIYSGRPDENEAIRNALDSKQAFIPKEKVMILGGESIDSTVDQVRQFRLPAGMELSDDDQLAVVIHSPQALRLLHMVHKVVEQKALGINLYKDFPINENTRIKVSPVYTPSKGFKEYSILEICGLLHYIYYDPATPASELPFPNYNL